MMKFIKHLDGIVSVDKINSISIRSIKSHPDVQGRLRPDGFGICLETDDVMNIVAIYQTPEEAEKGLDIFYKKLEKDSLILDEILKLVETIDANTEIILELATSPAGKNASC